MNDNQYSQLSAINSLSIPPGYKQTEVGVIPEDWEVHQLSEISKKITDGEHVTPNRTKHGYFLLSARNVLNGRVDVSDVDYVGSEEFTRIKQRCNPESGDILISCSGTIGRVAVVPDGFECVLVRSAALAKLDHAKVDSFFIQFWLQARNAQNQIFNSINQGAQPNLFLNHIERLRCPIPSKPEQEAIAGALGDADAFIESLEQLIAKKCHIKQGAMQELLTGKKRLPGFSGEWEVKRLGDVSTLYQPFTISANQFTTSGYPVYGANGIVGFYDKFNHDNWQITVTCRGSTCGTVNRTAEKCWITGNAMVVNCEDSQQLDKNFLYYLLTFQDLSICITGTGQPQIVRTPLANFEVIIPDSLEEQTAIASILSDMDAEITALETKLTKARHIKQGMMHNLLTGKIRLV